MHLSHDYKNGLSEHDHAPSGPVKLDIKHSTVININKSMNYFKQKYKVSFDTSRFERFQIKKQ